jgi:hypothetical protein
MPFTLRLGPVRYDSRRGVFTFKTRLIRIDSRTRTERTTAKTKRAKTRQDRRQTWQDLHQAARTSKTPTRGPLVPATGQPVAGPVKATAAAAGTPRAAGPSRAAAMAPLASVRKDPVVRQPGRAPDERAAQARRAGRCGGRTRDGSPCQRRGTCPPGTHH